MQHGQGPVFINGQKPKSGGGAFAELPNWQKYSVAGGGIGSLLGGDAGTLIGAGLPFLIKLLRDGGLGGKDKKDTPDPAHAQATQTPMLPQMQPPMPPAPNQQPPMLGGGATLPPDKPPLAGGIPLPNIPQDAWRTPPINPIGGAFR